MKRFKGFVVVVAVCLLILEESGGSAEPVARLQEHDECTSEDDPRLLKTCLLGDQFKRGHQCQVTPGLTCLGQMYVGDGSVCTRLGTRQFFRCSLGVWKDNTDSEDVNDFPAHDIQKRGFSWRTAICYVGRIVYWRNRCRRRSSGGGGQQPANRPPSFNYCPSVPQQTADPGTLTKTVSWPPPTATDPDGGSPSITTAGSHTSGSVFHEGTTTVLYKARDSPGGTDYCTVTVQVAVVRCRTGYRQLQNGEQQCSGPQHDIYGSRCTHHCDYGYQLVGDSSVVQCQSNGRWSHAFPTCQEKTCTPLTAPSNSHVTCTHGYTEGSECTVTCNPGYELQGGAITRCDSSGSWNSSLPVCNVPYSPPTNDDDSNESDDDSNESDDDDDDNTLLLIVGPVCGAVALILIIVLIVLIVYRKNRLPNAGYSQM